jgi:squalene cyclase
MRDRCKNPKYIKNILLEGYKLSFCTINKNYGVANIIKKLDSKVPGGVWKISANDERELDYYEGFPIKYTKDFFTLNDEKIMFYIIKRQYSFKSPQRWYVDIINQGYKDCKIDREYLRKRLRHHNIDL